VVTDIHLFIAHLSKQDVDGGDNPRIKSGDGHDTGEMVQYDWNTLKL
jgi:hypothetical protein